MGYAFLYGVIGSLIGSNLGGAMYESMLKPFAGNPAAAGEFRTFWLLFAGLGVLAMLGLLLYNRFFSADTPAANMHARRIMIGIYLLLLALGGWFFFVSALGGETVAYKTMVQAVIMILIGAGGIIISLRHPAPAVEHPDRMDA